jgi:hypothetical protein
MSHRRDEFRRSLHTSPDLTGFMLAWQHWTKVGYSDASAIKLAQAKWARDPELRNTALAYVLAHTNQRQCDLI